MLLHRGPSRAAVFDRPAGRDPALAVEDAVPLQEIVAREALAAVNLGGEAGGQAGGEEGAHFVAKGALVGGGGQVQGGGSRGESGGDSAVRNLILQTFAAGLPPGVDSG